MAQQEVQIVGMEKKKQNKTIGNAVLGCFLKNGEKDENTLAMVCRHVTKCSNGLFYIDEECKKIVAQNIDNSGTDLEDLTNDVDLVKLSTSPEHLLNPIYRNASGKKMMISLYEGTVTELENTQIFQCRRSKKENMGRVLQKGSVPDINGLDLERNFIVDDINGESFAKKGDSGRVVAREKDGDIELVGIITWGQYQCHGCDGSLSICMLLKYAIEFLNKKYQYRLSLLEHKTDKNDDNDQEFAVGDNQNNHTDGANVNTDDSDDTGGASGDTLRDGSGDKHDDGNTGSGTDDENDTVEPGQIIYSHCYKNRLDSDGQAKKAEFVWLCLSLYCDINT